MTLEITSLNELRTVCTQWRAAGERIAFVPSMGALHAGHMALVAAAKKHADRVVVSIFVNPTQFGPNEDFSRYPRPLAEDLALLRDAAVDAVWLPTAEEMYPTGFATSIHVAGVSEAMEGAIRPGHFDGMAMVVAKLFNQVAPHVAIFGEKDYQQLCVIRQLVRDLNMAVEIIGLPTVREADGLALSSRNRYLSAHERAVAPLLYRTLTEVAVKLRANEQSDHVLLQAKQEILAAGFAAVDYLELRDAGNLQQLNHYVPGARLLVAARLGATRLIDNIEV